ncbi:hypothetical protein QMG83_06555 [Salinibacterium sp. G-O1]|uniref:hypothetical protein n=1 Tax=Salinibacterium sp. G-O1 TaxID=3046208 RepID=UPI0024B9AE8C|nr:hypothetical protein [Salinibacterium sp. G-O1]MDJ0334880.1 hypothetical protein [Salinibacterium sp. G-O1]
MGRIPGYYEWDDDGLTPGRKKEGGLHQNLFDADGNLKGSARFVPTDVDEPEQFVVTETVYVPVEERRRTREQEELENAISDLLTALVLVGIEKARPHVEQWWSETLRPFVSHQWSRIRGPRREVRTTELGTSSTKHDSMADRSTQSIEVASGDRPKMSSAEAQARLLAAIAAQAYSDEQMRLVASAEIVDADGLAEVQAALAQLQPEVVAGLIKKMVTNPSMFDEETLAELASVLARKSSSAPNELRRPPLEEE